MANENDPTRASEQAKAAEELAKNTERLNRVLEEYEQTQKRVEKIQESLKINEEEQLSIAQARERLNSKALEQEEALAAEKAKRVEIENRIRTLMEAQENQGQVLEEAAQKELESLNARLDAQERLIQGKRNEIKDIEAKQRLIKKLSETEEKYGKNVRDNLEKAEEAAGSFAGMFKDAADDIPVIGGQIKKLMNLQTKIPGILNKVASNIGSIVEGGGTLGKVLGRFGAQGIVKGLSTAISGMAITTIAVIAAVTLFVGKLVKMALEVNNLSKELGAATGFGDQFNKEITRMGVQGNLAGIGFKESSAALKALTQGLSSFNPKAEKTNEYMGMTVARLEKLGVSAASSVKSMEHMQRSMGMTGKQAADATAQLARMGKEIGITGAKMIEDFNSASGRLAIYGKQNIKVFKELAAAAKASGIEMQTLLGITEKFDKFDSAADSAAKLNAVLGTQLSTLEMMQATDSERILMLKQQVQMSVGNFDSLDKYTKQYIAQAMGVKDVAEAQKLLNMSMAEYQQYEKGQKQQADIQKELSEATESLVPVMTQLKLAFIQFFMAFEPIIMLFAGFFKMLNPIISLIARFIAFIAPAIVTLGSLAVVIAKVFAGASALAGVLNPITAGVLLFIGAVSWLYQIFGKRLNPLFVQIFHFLAEGLKLMMAPLKYVINGVGKLGSKFSSFFGIAKKGASEFVNKDSFNIQALATMNTDKVSAGISKVKSALMELSTVKIDGFLAMTTDGTNSSFIMGSEGMIKNISEGKLVVDVKMPEMKMPDVSVKVYIGDRELRDIIRTETKAVIARAG